MAHTPQQGSRVRSHLPEASPFSSVLARLPDLSPPRTKYTTSFGSLNPLSSPAPQSTFGFRPPIGSQTPGGPSDGSKAVAFDLLGNTPIKSIPPEQQLGSPRFELQSPKFPLFQPSPKKPLDSLRSPPSVRLGESTAGPVRSFSSPFGSLLDGSSRSAPSPADPAGLGASGPSPPPRGSASAPQRHQQRFAALFAQAGGALDAALGTGDILPPAGLDPAYLSPLRPSSASGMPRRTASTGSGAPNAEQEQEPELGSQQGMPAATAQADAAEGVPAAAVAGAASGAAAVSSGSGDAEVAAAAGVADPEVAAIEEEGEEEYEEDEEVGLDDEDDEDYTASASRFQRLPPRRRPATGAGAPGRQQQLFLPSQRPMRRRMLQFAAGGGAAAAAADEEVEATPLVHSTLPQSPMCQPVRMDVEMLLPIPKLRDPVSASEDGSGSPTHRMRSGGYSLDSPAVQAAAHAAVAAALEASAAGTGSVPGASRRPARAAAAGAAAAAKAAAEAAGTPVQRRGSSHLARTGSSGGGSLGSAPLTPDDGAAAQIVFSGPKKCNCKKSKCLKLYCDCFANGGFCGPSCSCVNCANKVENSEQVRKQREQIKQRNPNAFVQKIEADAALGGQHRRGCNCRKSHCMKKYCECFQAGVPCGEHCKCESCHNTAGQPGRRPPGGGASKRARSGASAPVLQPRTRQASTRLAAGASVVALSQQLKEAQAAAAASLQAAVAQATASMNAGSAAAAQGGAEEAGEGDAVPVGTQQPQPQILFPIPLAPGMLKAADGSSAPLMIPILLQQPGPGGAASAPLPLVPAATAAPALAAFAAAAASQPAVPAQPAAAARQAGQAAGEGAVPSHITPVASLLAPAGASAAAAGEKGAPAGPGFSFHPAAAPAAAPTAATDGSGSSSGQSTPRAAGGRAAAAAADVAFSLDTPAAVAGAAAAGGLAGGAGSILDQLLPAVAANGAAAAEAAGGTAAPAAGGSKGAAPSGVRATPTKRKPQRTMTAALM